MSLPKVFMSVCVVLFGAIALAAAIKHFGQKKGGEITGSTSIGHAPEIDKSPTAAYKIAAYKSVPMVQEVDINTLQKNVAPVVAGPVAGQAKQVQVAQIVEGGSLQGGSQLQELQLHESQLQQSSENETESLLELFCPGSDCPIIQTIRYSSRVSWKPKRSAWLIDYANHHKTAVDFVLRSLNRGKSAKERPVSEGESFCVLRTDIPFSFLVVVEAPTCTMKLYYLLPSDEGLKIKFLKQYQVGLGRVANEKASGILTPYGLFRLGARVAVFRPGMTGMYKGKKVEQIQVFGTRWIPFEREIADCTEPAKGFGIHGTPWLRVESGQLIDQAGSIGKFESDGCIRMRTADIEEIYSVISSRPGYVEIVPSFAHSKLLSGKLQLP